MQYFVAAIFHTFSKTGKSFLPNKKKKLIIVNIKFYSILLVEVHTFTILAGDMAFVLGDVGPQYVLHEDLETHLLLRTELLQYRARLRTCLEVTCTIKPLLATFNIPYLQTFRVRFLLVKSKSN